MTNRQLFQHLLAPTSPSALMLEIERGEGIYLYDPNGNKYIDAISGIAVSALGHCHPNIVEAINKQSKKFMHAMVYGEFVLSPQTQLAKFICSLLPSNLQSVYFTNSGAEATETAMKLAKRVTGKSNFIAFKNAYHGSTQGALSLMGNEYFKSAFRPLLPGVKHIEYNNLKDLSLIDDNTAAVFFEPIQAETGVVIPDINYVIALRQKCNETNTLLVFDEIQTGCGRTGFWFAFEKYGIVPDILLLAKGLGAGLPLGAVISSKENLWTFTENPVLGHITTFGGNPVCCAASLAMFETIDQESLISTILKKEALFSKLLKHPKINAFNHAGLLMAIHFETAEFNQKVIQRCIEKGLITDWFLFAPNALRIAPPLIINDKEIILICDIILESINEIDSFV
ncbi:MAG: aspartate aminotransferase family protein [Bacteroidetes bacterium]|nr:aspartate aminotransferase family protein [Bacteroidota bacterium]